MVGFNKSEGHGRSLRVEQFARQNPSQRVLTAGRAVEAPFDDPSLVSFRNPRGTRYVEVLIEELEVWGFDQDGRVIPLE